MRIVSLVPATIISITALSLLMTACSPQPAGSTIPLEGTYWTLESYLNGQGESQSVLPETVVDAIFKDGSVAGTDGCNQYSAPFEINGDQITIQPGVSTLMACSEPIMTQAQEYMAALASAATFNISGSTLTIVNEDGKTVLSFKAGDTSLEGTSWIATAYNNGKEAVVSVMSGSEITADFSQDGKLSGSAGCNNYNAGYTVDGDSIQITAPASTRMMCASPEGVMEQEAAYLAAIEKAASFELRGNSLTLRDSGGSILAQYTKK